MVLTAGATVDRLVCTGGAGAGLTGAGGLGVCVRGFGRTGWGGAGVAFTSFTVTISIIGSTCGGVVGAAWPGVMTSKPKWAAPIMPKAP